MIDVGIKTIEAAIDISLNAKENKWLLEMSETD